MTIKVKAETKREPPRSVREDTPQHRWVGDAMHDRMIGALETCCRIGEMLKIQNRHDLRHEGACRLLADRVDLRTIQLMLGHADIKQTQTYLNITTEELRRAMKGTWERRRKLQAVSQAS